MNFKEKVRHMVKMGVSANRIVEEALENRKIYELKKFTKIKREMQFSKETRFDFLLENENKK